jgi:predicted oxidoreductase
MRSNGGFFPTDSSVADKMPLLEKWADKYGISRDAMAIAWINQLPIVQSIIGTTNSDRIADTLKCADTEIDKKDWYNIYTDMGNLVP